MGSQIFISTGWFDVQAIENTFMAALLVSIAQPLFSSTAILAGRRSRDVPILINLLPLLLLPSISTLDISYVRC